MCFDLHGSGAGRSRTGIEEELEGKLQTNGWPGRLDLSRWGLWLAHDGGETIGAVAVAWDTPGLHMLEGRRDLAGLWDIRVRPEWRGQGVGKALFGAAAWAKGKGCAMLKIETQNVNGSACRFYRKMGCFLRLIDRMGCYGAPAVSGETLWIWSLDLRGGGGSVAET